MSFLDVEGCFVLKQHDSIFNFAFEYHGHVGVNWMVFGTSGRTTVDGRPVMQKCNAAMKEEMKMTLSSPS